MRVVTYECQEPLRETERFLSFLVHEVTVTDKKKNAVSRLFERLPVAFRSESYQGSQEAALRFWASETAKKQHRSEWGKELARRNRKAASNL
jgi:hypothetical protein